MILVLGGGNEARGREALRTASNYPSAPVVVTGDGGTIWSEVAAKILPASRLFHEEAAQSTYQNAIFTDPILSRLGAKRVLIVSNWFHIPRALAVFRRLQPNREFAGAFEKKPEPLTRWDVGTQRRERLAAIGYLFRYGICCF